MGSRAYAPHERLIAPARKYPSLWRLVVGLVVVGSVAFALNSILQSVLIALAPTFWAEQFATVKAQGRTPLSMIVLLFSFSFVTVGVLTAARCVQHRPPLGLVGPLPLALVQFWRVARLLAILGAVVLLLPPYNMGEPLNSNLDGRIWLALLPLSLIAVLIQSSAEEILFRGYIQQALAARFSSPLVWMILPATFFALGHYLPAEAGENAVFIAVWAGIFGILMADLTARAGTLGPAIAVHMVNNISALLFISLPDSLNGLSLYTIPFEMSDTEQLRSWLVVDFFVMLVTWLAARVAIRR